MRIQHNIMAMNSYRNYTANNSSLSKNLEKLSSGYKINRAGDDAAGLAISEKMRAQITGLETAQKNAQSGINLVQTAEGALTEVHDMLNRMVELADQSANGTYDDTTDRANLQKEFAELSKEIDRIADASNFNGKSLLDGTLAKTVTTEAEAAKSAKYSLTVTADEGDVTYAGKTVTYDTSKENTATLLKAAINGDTNSAYSAEIDADDATKVVLTAKNAGVDTPPADAAGGTHAVVQAGAAAVAEESTGGLTLQIGDTAKPYNQITVGIDNMHASSLGIGASSISTQTDASDAVTAINSAIDKVSGTRGNLGATQNRLEHTINNLSVMTENVQDAEANIRDVDVAKEMMEYTKNNILVQSAQAMLAQANQVPQGVLQLLQ